MVHSETTFSSIFRFRLTTIGHLQPPDTFLGL